MHLVPRDDFRSREKDGGHTILYAITENLMLHANPIVLFHKPQLLPIEVLHCGNGDFQPFCSCDLDCNLHILT